MEEGMSLPEQIRSCFGCGKVDIRTYSPLTMAYIGDAIYDLVIRTAVVERGNRPAKSVIPLPGTGAAAASWRPAPNPLYSPGGTDEAGPAPGG